jgi:phosphoglycolate phosphatase-like HAD superfamily hydrolase
VAPERGPLVLFDIDGTLVRRAGPHHRQALVDAVWAVAGVQTTTDGIPVHGMLDPDILARMMSAAGMSAGRIRRLMPPVIAAAQHLYRCPDIRRRTCPGARALLRRLARRGIPLGLVTGNLTEIGWRKLEGAGLREYFRFGAFAEMARDRVGLVRLAIRQARRERWIGRDAHVALIGDAPSDVHAARANGIQSIAVRTGISALEELQAAGPDLLLTDLRQLELGMLRIGRLSESSNRQDN